MLKNLTLFSALLMLASTISIGKNIDKTYPEENIDSTKTASIVISPAKPLMEKDIFGYYLNFDITIRNNTKHVLEISSVEAAVMDKQGKLILRKVLGNDAKSRSDLIGTTLIKPGETVNIFNPFHTFQPDVSVASLKYGFFFNYADTKLQIENNKQRLPVDYDASTIKYVTPTVYIAKNEYNLPLKDRIIVWDGHDFYSRNRRTQAELTDKDLPVNESRYAYDLTSVDNNGSMYSGSPFKKQNWYVFGKPVFVPADGKVVEVRNDVPDNDFNGKIVQFAKMPGDQDLLEKGNYIIIKHANGEYSSLLNLEKGSIRVKPGDVVKSGQQIAQVGFSGNAKYPHLHYMVTNGVKDMKAEGLPNYFNDYKLYRGDNIVSIKRSRVDSGDIVESNR